MTTPELHPASLPLSRSLSRRLAMVAGLLFSGGVSVGWAQYLHRSATQVRYVAGSSAWWQHGLVALAAAAVLGVVWLRGRSGRTGWHVLLAPLGKSAAARISLLFRQALWHPAGFGRALLATPLLALFMFGFFRAGEQVTGGLDPNFTVNAWGGPTYIGAMACHYLDLLVLMAAVAWLLGRLLPRLRPGADRADSCQETRAAEAPRTLA